jgi:hypothetical protein
MSKAEEYVRARLKGAGSRDAAKTAGFAGGVPSPGARLLWKMTATLRELPQLAEASAPERARVLRELKRLRKVQANQRVLERAVPLLQELVDP